jgi:Raf kinase inhibitor-like YbhB/YbcL family protein
VTRASLILLAALAGCSYSLDVGSCKITCAASDECPQSMTCQAGFCAVAGSARCGAGPEADAEAPPITADATVAPDSTIQADAALPRDLAGPDVPRDSGGTADAPGGFSVFSPNFSKGTSIPPMFGCKNGGAGISPGFVWTPGPAGTKGYAIMLTMQGAARDEWILWDIPATTSTLPMNLPSGHPLSDPPGVKQWNWQGAPSYFGPCPPTAGALTTYYFFVFAVDVYPVPGIPRGTAFSAVIAAVKNHAIGTTQTSGNYVR